jgi:hypothetical protein
MVIIDILMQLVWLAAIALPAIVIDRTANKGE